LGVSRNVIRTLLKRYGLLIDGDGDGDGDVDGDRDGDGGDEGAALGDAKQYFSSSRRPTFARTHFQPRMDECL
jgi:hypothetical protein